MKLRKLGRTGLRVSEICLGGMTFGNQADRAATAAIVHRALEAGVNFFDTADAYNNGLSEEFLGSALRGVRDGAVVATKVHDRVGPGPNDEGLSRKHILAAVEASLRRLGTDYIDLYQVHRFDDNTPLEETLRALETLVQNGKIRYLGCSNFAAWQLCTALLTSEKLGASRFESLQPRYNLISREIEKEILPLCAAQGIGVIVYNPLAAGLLTGKHKRDAGPLPGTRFEFSELYRARYWASSSFDAVDRLQEIAGAAGRTPAQMAIAWVLGNPGVTSAIVGASRVGQLDETLASVDVTLTADEMGQLDTLWDAVGRQQTPV